MSLHTQPAMATAGHVRRCAAASQVLSQMDAYLALGSDLLNRYIFSIAQSAELLQVHSAEFAELPNELVLKIMAACSVHSKLVSHLSRMQHCH